MVEKLIDQAGHATEPKDDVRGSLLVNEIFLSIQGESSMAGWPCAFIRLTGCNLRCSYCDTAYAFAEGRRMRLSEVLDQIRSLAAPYASCKPRLPLVELTGGEPLMQPASLDLMRALCDREYTVLLETNGAWDISAVDPRVRRIVDLKCPSSGEQHRNRWENLACLTGLDEVKFVISTWADYYWAHEILQRYTILNRCVALFSWGLTASSSQRPPILNPPPAEAERLSQRELVEQMVADHLPARFQVQMQKTIWPAEARGV